MSAPTSTTSRTTTSNRPSAPSPAAQDRQQSPIQKEKQQPAPQPDSSKASAPVTMAVPEESAKPSFVMVEESREAMEARHARELQELEDNYDQKVRDTRSEYNGLIQTADVTCMRDLGADGMTGEDYAECKLRVDVIEQDLARLVNNATTRYQSARTSMLNRHRDERKGLLERENSLDSDSDTIPNIIKTCDEDYLNCTPKPLDNCRDVKNPDQADRDGDGIGDACETASTTSDHTDVLNQELLKALSDYLEQQEMASKNLKQAIENLLQ